MRILLYGEHWPGTVAYFYAKALRGLGHSVDVYDFTGQLCLRAVHGRLKQLISHRLFAVEAKRIGAGFLDTAAKGYDLIIVNKGLHLDEAAIVRAKRFASKVVNINQDDFFNARTGAAHIWSPWLEGAFREYDAILTPRLHRVAEYRSRGARKVVHVPFAFDPETHRPVTEAERRRDWQADVAFVGTWSPKREEYLAPIAARFSVRVWGASWHRAKWRFLRSAGVRIGRPLPCEKIPMAIDAAKIGINLYTEENYDDYSLRTFEVPACGGFTLAEESRTARGFFAGDREAAYFASIAEMTEKVEYYSRCETERRAISEAGYARAIGSGYDYATRAAEMLGSLA